MIQRLLRYLDDDHWVDAVLITMALPALGIAGSMAYVILWRPI